MGYSPRGRKESDTTERIQFHFHFLCNCPQALALSCMTQGWVFIHVHKAGVSAWMEKRCPAGVSRIQGELSGSICPGEVRTTCITGNQDGPCSRNTALLGYQEDPPRPLSKSLALDTGSCDAPIQLGSSQRGSQSQREQTG